jgi:carbon monoxide dehydrogenase subunit G
MAYEATVPVHRRLLWSAVTDPERLFAAVPNLTVEARTGQAVAARLRLRAGDRSITFRGIARLVETVPEQLRAVLEIEAVHGRSDGALDGRLELRLLAAGSGTRILIEPELALSGAAPAIAAPRLAEAAGRLIPRWFAQLVEVEAAADESGETEGKPESEAEPEPEPRHAPVPLSVVPDAAEQEAAEPAAAAHETPAPPAPPEPHGPTLTLINGDAEDASPSPKAPLRLVQAADRDEGEPPAEADLWSRGAGRWPGPVWVVAVAGLGSLGFALLVLRRMLRRG